jgi:uncharacterized protein YkwD
MLLMAARATAGAGLLLALAAVPSPAAPPAGGSGETWTDPARFASEVFRLTNVARVRQGLPAFRRDSRLDQAAMQYSRYMAAAGFFSHVGPNGSTMPRRLAAAGYRGMAMGENIGMGYRTPQAAVDGWMMSPGHRANILNRQFRDLGVGIAFARGVPFGTQDFGTEFSR